MFELFSKMTFCSLDTPDWKMLTNVRTNLSNDTFAGIYCDKDRVGKREKTRVGEQQQKFYKLKKFNFIISCQGSYFKK